MLLTKPQSEDISLLFYYSLLPSVLTLDVSSILSQFQQDYADRYTLSNHKAIPGGIECDLSFTIKYIQDWSNQWKENTRGLQEIIKQLQKPYKLRLHRSGLLSITCEEYNKEYLIYIYGKRTSFPF